MAGMTERRWAGAAAAVATMLLLGGCLLMPGKFTSDLDMRRDGTFTFSYQGEIQFMPFSEPPGKSKNEPFRETPCVDDNGDDRACTKQEIAAQKEEWKLAQSRPSRTRSSDAQQLRGILGGLDPEDPRAAQELADRMQRQAGYRSVTYKGEGIYLVDYAISSRLTHDFTFPSIEGFAINNALVQLTLRDGGIVRIEAPGFGPAGGSAMGAMMGNLPMPPGSSDGPNFAEVDGNFTITTDAAISANNTEEGPAKAPNGQTLHWRIDEGTRAAPMALLTLQP